MTVQHKQQIKDWNGDTGKRWIIHQLWLDQMLDAFGKAAMAAAQPKAGEYILDIGCGAGTTSLALIVETGDQGHVMGVDISAPLIEKAQERSADNERLSFLLADAGQADLPKAHFDILYSRFGVMFFDDPVAAFSHLSQSLKPAGRLAFICWRKAEENDWVRLPMAAIKGIVAPSAPLPADAPGPFSFGDTGRVKDILGKAGFDDVAFTPFDHDIVFGSGNTGAEAVENALHMAFELGPLSRALADESDDVRQRASQAVRDAFAKQVVGNDVMINGAAWVVTARIRGG